MILRQIELLNEGLTDPRDNWCLVNVSVTYIPSPRMHKDTFQQVQAV